MWTLRKRCLRTLGSGALYFTLQRLQAVTDSKCILASLHRPYPALYTALRLCGLLQVETD